MAGGGSGSHRTTSTRVLKQGCSTVSTIGSHSVRSVVQLLVESPCTITHTACPALAESSHPAHSGSYTSGDQRAHWSCTHACATAAEHGQAGRRCTHVCGAARAGPRLQPGTGWHLAAGRFYRPALHSQRHPGAHLTPSRAAYCPSPARCARPVHVPPRESRLRGRETGARRVRGVRARRRSSRAGRASTNPPSPPASTGHLRRPALHAQAPHPRCQLILSPVSVPWHSVHLVPGGAPSASSCCSRASATARF